MQSLRSNDKKNKPSSTDTLQPWLVHSGSVIWGLVACQFFFDRNIVYLIALAVIIYPALMLTHSSRKCGIIVACITVTFLLTW